MFRHDTSVSRAGSTARPPMALLVESEISRYLTPWRLDYRSAALKFSSDVEQQFETDTCKKRVRELRVS
ncbi:MAG TPA: hypothetical protein VHN11_05875, partial [Xanthobacteraceae bacterium]|nr:hypothetical protein [Xanthobacteraceae bacterium]